eukprot:TRINITY_DN805_c0_g1_i1.p1 TRINITY_DN805_c0_g1~~TRINITY_DN805_c0_g1_i1.p1  ORF type:complete len:437 (-),score=123.46 TRINITY_DN805_c0_g1_i1:184-1494(-)
MSEPGAPAENMDAAAIARKAAEDKKEMTRKLHGYRERKEKPDENASHPFWDTMPVPKMAEGDVATTEEVGPMENKTLEEVPAEPYPLPSSEFVWSTMDVTDDAQLAEIYKLLFENYVEDDDNMFRFDYSPEFLRWALMPPGYIPDWHVGVRWKGKKGDKNNLVGFITGIPANIRTGDNVMGMCEINFLCCWKKLRGKRLAPLLIKEVTRRVNVTGIWQAVYTAGVVLPKPITVCRYWHRSLNPKKLIAVDFSRKNPRLTMKATEKLYSVPKETQIPGIRPMTESDVPSACDLLNGYLMKFKLHPTYDHDEFRHWLLPRNEVIQTYVVADEQGVVTDMCSFYTLPSTIMNHPEYNSLKAAYSYYNVATTVSLEALMGDALTLAKRHDFDVFNALDLMDNREFIDKLKFGMGDGNLQYYLFNWRTNDITPDQTGLVLL